MVKAALEHHVNVAALPGLVLPALSKSQRSSVRPADDSWDAKGVVAFRPALEDLYF